MLTTVYMSWHRNHPRLVQQISFFQLEVSTSSSVEFLLPFCLLLDSTCGPILHKYDTLLSAAVTIIGPLNFRWRQFSTHLSVSSTSSKQKLPQSNQCHIVSVELSDVTVLFDMICRTVILNPACRVSTCQFQITHQWTDTRQANILNIKPSYVYNPFMKSNVLTGHQLRLLILLRNPIYLWQHVICRRLWSNCACCVS